MHIAIYIYIVSQSSIFSPSIELLANDLIWSRASYLAKAYHWLFIMLFYLIWSHASCLAKAYHWLFITQAHRKRLQVHFLEKMKEIPYRLKSSFVF